MTSTNDSTNQLSTICSCLVASSQTADDAVRDFVHCYPAGRQDVAALSRELGDLRMAAGLLQRNNEVPARQRSASVTPNVRSAVVGVARSAMTLVDLIIETVRQPDSSRESWLQEVASSLSDLSKQAETLRMALNLGLDSLLFAESELASIQSDLPPYQTTQIIQLVVTVRARVMDLNDGDDAHSSAHVPALLELLGSVQQYIEHTSSFLVVPPGPRGESLSVPSGRSDVASVHSDAGPPPPPAIEQIHITNPTPGAIYLRHISKTNTGTTEIHQLEINEYKSELVIFVSSWGNPIRMFDLTGITISGMVGQSWGIHMTFCERSPLWAYLTDIDISSLIGETRYRDDFRVRKPATWLYNRATNKRLQALHGVYAQPLAFSSEGTHFAVTKPGGRVAIIHNAGINLNNQKVVHCIHTDDVTHGVFTPDASAFVSISRDGSIRLTDPDNGEPLGKLDVDTWKRPQFLGITPDGHVIVSIWGDTVYHWEYAIGNLDTYVLGARRRLEGRPIAISRDCRFLACSTHDGVDVSDLHTGHILRAIRFQGGYVTAAAFSHDGRYLAVGKAVGGYLRVTKATLDVWELVF